MSTTVIAEMLTRGPYLQQGSSSSMMIKWRTDLPAPSNINYGTQLSELSSNASGVAGTDHSVLISGLAANTRYYYALVDDQGGILAGGDSSHYFYTSPVVGSTEPARVWVIGDSGTANSNAIAVKDAYLARTGAEYTDLWIMLGDNAYSDGTDSEYQAAVFNIYPELLKQSPLWSTLGNHDGHSANSASQDGPYYDIFSLPSNGEVGGVPSGTEAYYSFDYGQIHFISLESYETDRAVNGPMLTWLVNDLEATTQPWIIAFWHHPPYTKGSHNSDSETRLIQMRENALPILESYGVDLVLSGHSHSYERSYLIDSHYGSSSSFNEVMKLDGGDGDKTGDGSYQKTVQVKEPNKGAVYLVAGSSGKVSGGTLDHPAMFASFSLLGSVILEVVENELTANFLDNNNIVRDSFTILKGSDLLPPEVTTVKALDESQIMVTFSENISEQTATNIANFHISDGVNLLGAQLSENMRQVILTTSPLTPSVTYTLTINGVKDLSQNLIAANSQQVFSYINLITIEFQDGLSPTTSYSGTSDAYISEQNPSTNYGSHSSLLIDGDDGGGVDLSTLLQWQIEEIPADAIIEAVSITLDVYNPSSSSYQLFKVTRDWHELEVTWTQYKSGAAWQQAGGMGAGDIDVIPLASMSPYTGSYIVNLNNQGIEVVQSWVDGSESNRGFIIANTAASDGADIYSSESTHLAPKLSVTYSIPTPAEDTLPPAQVQNLQQTAITTHSINLSWHESSDNVAVSGYKIERDGEMITSVTSTTYVDEGLSSATTYSYRIVAFDGANNESSHSAPLEVTTEAAISSVHVEDIDMSIVSAGRKKVRAVARITLYDNLGSPVSGANVQAAWSGAATETVAGVSDNEGSVSFTARSVNQNSNEPYLFSVDSVAHSSYSYDEAENVESSDCIEISGMPCSGIDAPTGLAANFDTDHVNLSWSSVTQASSYKVYRSDTPASGYQLLSEVSNTSYQDTDVVFSQRYYYVVSASNGSDESAYSLEVAVDTGLTGPTELKVDSVLLTLKRKGPRYDVIAQAQISDSDNLDAGDALVSGFWTLANGDEQAGITGLTDLNGRVSFTLPKVNNSSDVWYHFTVTDIERGSDEFDNVQVTGTVQIP